MATHSSILAWKIPWLEEPGRLQSVGSQRVGLEWMASLSFFSHGWSSRLSWSSLHYGWTREGNGTPLQYSCLENPMDGGAWWAAVHGVAKSRTQLSNFTFTFRFHALEKEMATHSIILAWRTPGTGELGGLPSMGSHSRTRLKWLSSSSRLYKNALERGGSRGCRGSPGGPRGKDPPANAGNARGNGLAPGLRRSPGGGNGNPLQYPCLENPMDRGAWWATVHGAAESRTWLKQLIKHAEAVGRN